jgi:Ribbon-helix-helix protein, copG family.
VFGFNGRYSAISTRLPSELLELARARARALGLTRSAYIRMLIENDVGYMAHCPIMFLACYGNPTKVLWELNVRPLNVLLPASVYWSGGKFAYSHEFEMVYDMQGLFFLDSGAYTLLASAGAADYPFTPRQYVEFVGEVNPHFYATMDIPVGFLVEMGRSVTAGMRKTVENTVDIIEEAEKLAVKSILVPVLQGYNDVNDWLENYDMYREHGVTADKFRFWAVGSIVRIQDSIFIRRLIAALKRYMGDVKLHMFGLKLGVVRKLFNMVDSFDTSIWIYFAKKGELRVWSSRRKKFIPLVPAKRRSLPTEDLFEILAMSMIHMHRDLCMNARRSLSLRGGSRAVLGLEKSLVDSTL